MDELSLHRIVTEKYRLDNTGTLTRLAGGEKNRVYKISSLDLVVRVYQPTAPLDGIVFEHKLMAILSEQMECVVKPLCYEPDKTFFYWGEHPVSIEPFIYGEKPTRKNCEDIEFCYKAGKILGQLHKIATENADRLPSLSSRIPIVQMNPFYNQFYDWDIACKWLSTTKFAKELPYIKSQLEDLSSFIKEQKDMLFVPIHGDYYKGNLLWNGENIIGIIDFDDTRNEWAEYEIARTLWEFTRNYNSIELDQARQEAYLNGYSSANPRIKHDMGLYSKINKLVRLHEILATAASMINGDLLYSWNNEDEEYHWNNLQWSK